MKSVIIIPARYASSRYMGKPLALLTLPDGRQKSLIEMSYETACKVSGIDAVYVATDESRIANAAKDFGAEVIMTSDTLWLSHFKLRRGNGFVLYKTH